MTKTIPEEVLLQRLGDNAPSLSTSEVGVFTVTSVTQYPDLLGEIAEVAELTPHAAELVTLANDHPAPDEWWDEED